MVGHAPVRIDGSGRSRRGQKQPAADTDADAAFPPKSQLDQRVGAQHPGCAGDAPGSRLGSPRGHGQHPADPLQMLHADGNRSGFKDLARNTPVARGPEMDAGVGGRRHVRRS